MVLMSLQSVAALCLVLGVGTGVCPVWMTAFDHALQCAPKRPILFVYGFDDLVLASGAFLELSLRL